MTQTSTPLVSVVIPTYNRPKRLVAAVESVLAQTYDRIELVVVDDHSKTPATDALSELPLDSLSAVQCLRHEENRGASAARNTAIANATGEYVAFLDDDDRWDASKLAKQVAAFETADDRVGVVYTGRRVAREFTPEIEGDITKALLCDNFIGTFSTVMVRADAIERTGTLDEGVFGWEDWEWYVRLSTDWWFASVPEPLTDHIVSSHGQISDDFERKRNETYPAVVKRFRPLAAEYGSLFERKSLGFVTFAVASDAIYNGEFEAARRYLLRAIRFYPFAPLFYGYLFTLIGGKRTFELAKTLNLRRTVSRLDLR